MKKPTAFDLGKALKQTTAKVAAERAAILKGIEFTSKDVAKIAAIGIRNPHNLTDAQIKKVCASALTQAPNKKHDTIPFLGEEIVIKAGNANHEMHVFGTVRSVGREPKIHGGRAFIRLHPCQIEIVHHKTTREKPRKKAKR